MIILDLKPFSNQDDQIISAINSNKYETITTKRAVYDELHIIEDTNVSTSSERKEWTYNTVFLWECDNSLEAGNVGLKGLPINQLKIRKRKKGELTFEDVKVFDFDPDKQTYSFKDRFVESYEDYIYGIQPMGGSIEDPILGETTTHEVSTEFESAWLVGKDRQYKLIFDLEIGDYEHVVPSEIIETLGGQFPIVSSSGNLRYKRGNLKCMLMSQEIVNRLSPKEEKAFRKIVMDFLLDRKPKLFKDGSGEYMLISIIGNPLLTPNNNLSQLVYNLSIEFVEIGETNSQSLIDSGLLVMQDDNE